MSGQIMRHPNWNMPPTCQPPAPHPPGCQCGCECDGPQWGSGLMQCWGEIAMLKKIIAEIIGDMGGPVKTGPIQGVVDGSWAKPGEVGEMLYFNPTGPTYIGTAGVQEEFLISAGVVPPGDWQLTGLATTTSAVEGFRCWIEPGPPTMNGNMPAWFYNAGIGTTVPTDFSQVSMVMQTSELSSSTPTLLPFKVITWGAGATGSVNLYIKARRLR